VGCDVISSLVVCIAIGGSMVLELWSNFMVDDGGNLSGFQNGRLQETCGRGGLMDK